MRMKRALALVAILIAIAVVSFLVYRRANRPRTDAPAGVGRLRNHGCAYGRRRPRNVGIHRRGAQAAIRVAGGSQGEPIRRGSPWNLRPEQRF